MKIQSLSIHVPTDGCINKCKGCVSRMHKSPYKNRIGPGVAFNGVSKSSDTLDEIEDWKYAKRDYQNRLEFAKENKVNTLILTGTGEPLQNTEFLYWLLTGDNAKFQWIELQTTGNYLMDLFSSYKTYFSLLKEFNVSTISLSLWDMFSSENNTALTGMLLKDAFDIDELCKEIKKNDFNLRLSLNMTDVYNDKSSKEIFEKAKELGANQITFRKLYKSENENCKQDKWIEEHSAGKFLFDVLNNCISQGKFLGKLPFGASKYSVNGISTVVDNNCMDDATKREEADSYKYLILRPNCKLYSHWDDEGSLIF